MKKKIFFGILGVLLLAAGVALFILLRTNRTEENTEIVDVDPGLTLFLGGGGNSGIVIDDSAVVVIDTKMMGNSEDLFKLAQVKAAGKPIIVLNTHNHGDHVSGNKMFKGSRIYMGANDTSSLAQNVDPENLPTDIVSDSLAIELGSETLLMVNLGRGHTTNDCVVYLQKHNILFTGDLVFFGYKIVLNRESAARVPKWIAALETMLRRWGDARVVPGHGPVGDRKMLETMHQYLADLMAADADPTKDSRMKEKF